MYPTKRSARVTGLLYLLVVLTGPFVLIYVPGKLFVPGDATAMAAKIFAHQSLFKAHILVSLMSELCFIAAVLALYRLLKGVHVEVATLMVVIVLIDAPLAFLSVANELATLNFIRGADFLSVFNKAQTDTLATLLLNVDRHGLPVSNLFWGLWLFPLAWLVYRSGFLPRLLGAWLTLNGLAYLTISFTGILSPQHVDMVSTYTTPLLFGEVALMLWLLIFGVRVPGTEPELNA